MQTLLLSLRATDNCGEFFNVSKYARERELNFNAHYCLTDAKHTQLKMKITLERLTVCASWLKKIENSTRM
jgi:hypothetical protein